MEERESVESGLEVVLLVDCGGVSWWRKKEVLVEVGGGGSSGFSWLTVSLSSKQQWMAKRETTKCNNKINTKNQHSTKEKQTCKKNTSTM